MYCQRYEYQRSRAERKFGKTAFKLNASPPSDELDAVLILKLLEFNRRTSMRTLRFDITFHSSYSCNFKKSSNHTIRMSPRSRHKHSTLRNHLMVIFHSVAAAVFLTLSSAPRLLRYQPHAMLALPVFSSPLLSLNSTISRRSDLVILDSVQSIARNPKGGPYHWPVVFLEI